MNVLTSIAFDRFSFGYTATGITLDAMGITWMKGVRRLVLRNRSTTNIYMTNGTVAPTTASFTLTPGAVIGTGNEVVIHGTVSDFKKLLFTGGVGETCIMNVQQDNDMATKV